MLSFFAQFAVELDRIGNISAVTYDADSHGNVTDYGSC